MACLFFWEEGCCGGLILGLPHGSLICRLLVPSHSEFYLYHAMAPLFRPDFIPKRFTVDPILYYVKQGS